MCKEVRTAREMGKTILQDVFEEDKGILHGGRNSRLNGEIDFFSCKTVFCKINCETY